MSNVSMSEAELLQFAIENGMLDTALVQEKIEMQRKEELLNKHPYSIWVDKKGIWHTYLPDKEKGRITRKRCSFEEIQNLIVEYWKEQDENPAIKDIFEEWIESKLETKRYQKLLMIGIR